MNLKKILGRAKRSVARNTSRSTTLSSSSTQFSPPTLACSNRDVPNIQMNNLRITTSRSKCASSASTLSEPPAATISRGLSRFEKSQPQEQTVERKTSSDTEASDTWLVRSSGSPSSGTSRSYGSNASSASDDSPSNKAAGDGSEVEQKQQEEAVLKAWGKSQELKKLAIPTDYPDYMRDAPQLVYSETEASLLRKQYIAKKIESYKHRPLKRKAKLLQPGPRPKLNRTTSLRNAYICRQPIMSQRFQNHYSLYNRPPFRLTNIKLGL